MQQAVDVRKKPAGAAAPNARQNPDLPNVLRGAGLRKTAARVAVLERLRAAKFPVSHSDMAKSLARSGFDRATVYRNLIDLVDAGLARRSDLGDHVWRFEAIRGVDLNHAADHAHFTCIECGSIACLPRDAVRLQGSKDCPRSLSQTDVEVNIRGRCDRCA